MTDDYEALEDKLPLSPARGVVIGLVAGAFIWVVIVVLGLGLFNRSVLLIASPVMLVAICVASLIARALRGPNIVVGRASMRRCARGHTKAANARSWGSRRPPVQKATLSKLSISLANALSSRPQ